MAARCTRPLADDNVGLPLPLPVYPAYTRGIPATTIKVPSDLRDGLNSEARQANTTVAGVIEALIAERERSERFRTMREAMAGVEARRGMSYERETAEWDSTLRDGLDDA